MRARLEAGNRLAAVTGPSSGREVWRWRNTAMPVTVPRCDPGCVRPDVEHAVRE